jgi:hypothetical protein
LQDVVQGLGAVAGLAGVAGLAVLAALHVAQARDVKRLREWAGRAPERAGAGVAAVPPPVPPRRLRSGPIGKRRVAVALAGLLLVLGGPITYAITRSTGGGGSGTAQAKGGDGASSKPKRGSVAVRPGTVTVAVLNGTTVPHLAATLRDRVAVAGFSKGMINDFADQQRAESVVQYAPGRQAEANEVGRTLGISRREPVTAESRALAGDATVIVVAGADQAP